MADASAAAAHHEPVGAPEVQGGPVELGPARSSRSYWSDLLLNRTLPALFFATFLVYQLVNVGRAGRTLLTHPGAADSTAWLNGLNQAMLLAYYVLLVTLFVVRLPRRSGRRTPLRITVAMLTTFSVIPVILLPVTQPQLGIASTVLIGIGVAYAIWSLAYLRRSFSILPEARRLVTGGPYGLSRHPLYLGEIVAAAGLILPRISPLSLLLLGLLIAGQYVRLGWEEEALSAQFPADYAAYRRRTGRYLPDPRRRAAEASDRRQEPPNQV